MSQYDDFGDFMSDDPLERYNAHQRAKGRAPLPDPDLIRKQEKERRVRPGCTCGGRSICTVCCLADLEGLLP